MWHTFTSLHNHAGRIRCAAARPAVQAPQARPERPSGQRGRQGQHAHGEPARQGGRAARNRLCRGGQGSRLPTPRADLGLPSAAGVLIPTSPIALPPLQELLALAAAGGDLARCPRLTPDLCASLRDMLRDVEFWKASIAEERDSLHRMWDRWAGPGPAGHAGGLLGRGAWACRSGCRYRALCLNLLRVLTHASLSMHLCMMLQPVLHTNLREEGQGRRQHPAAPQGAAGGGHPVPPHRPPLLSWRSAGAPHRLAAPCPRPAPGSSCTTSSHWSPAGPPLLVLTCAMALMY